MLLLSKENQERLSDFLILVKNKTVVVNLHFFLKFPNVVSAFTKSIVFYFQNDFQILCYVGHLTNLNNEKIKLLFPCTLQKTLFDVRTALYFLLHIRTSHMKLIISV